MFLKVAHSGKTGSIPCAAPAYAQAERNQGDAEISVIERCREAPFAAPGGGARRHEEPPRSQPQARSRSPVRGPLMAASRALRLGFALSLTGTGYVNLSLLHVPGNLRVTFVYARVTN